MRKIIVALTVSCLISAASIVFADGAVTAVAKEGLKGAFNELEKQMIKEYFKENEYVHYTEDDDGRFSEEQTSKGKSKNKGKNKGKNKDLPSGIAKNLQRGKPLPPGIAKRDLPSELSSSLPSTHDGYESTVVGNDVVLVDIDTGEIADIIVDAVLGN